MTLDPRTPDTARNASPGTDGGGSPAPAPAPAPAGTGSSEPSPAGSALPGAPPHGGRLVDRLVPADQRDEMLRWAAGLRRVVVDAQAAADLELIAVGAYSPLTGFMDRDDYESVLESLTLDSGWTWTLPVTLNVDPEEARQVREGETVALAAPDGTLLALLDVEDRFRINKGREAAKVYGTQDPGHPGVHALYRRGGAALGGPVRLLQRPPSGHRSRILDPAAVRAEIQRRGWRTVVGFQTRNPLHRAHEYLQKCALELYDGLLLHPLVGPTKDDDVPAGVRIDTYDAVLAGYYPGERVLLSLFPAAMRYAGPREAVFHAICRQNYGCTHFIVGRSHAGVGDFYGPYDAWRLFEQIPRGGRGLAVEPLFFEDAFYCRACGGMATARTCPHPENLRVSLSGTEVRRMLAAGRPLPPEFTRPEVGTILLEHARAAAARGGWGGPPAPAG
ncbi:MAG: sulfate adenylyltransferase [Thermaerobacter sp.]